VPFGVVRGVGRGMGVLDFGSDRQREGAVLGVNLRRPIVTNGDFVALLCRSASSDRVVVWSGEWGGPNTDVLDGVYMPQGEGAVLGIFRHLRPHWFEWAERHIVCRLVCES